MICRLSTPNATLQARATRYRLTPAHKRTLWPVACKRLLGHALRRAPDPSPPTPWGPRADDAGQDVVQAGLEGQSGTVLVVWLGLSSLACLGRGERLSWWFAVLVLLCLGGALSGTAPVVRGA